MKPTLKLSAFLLLAVVLFYLSCKKELDCYNCIENKPPIAIAGIDQKITLPKDSVTLDGSASTDPDGTITSYKWIKIAGPSSSNIVKADSSKTLVKALAMGVYKFELIVKDNGGLTAKDTVQIIVDDPQVNQPPLANAFLDQTIILPIDSTLLNGSFSFDPDGTIISYHWAKLSGPTSNNILKPDSSKTLVKGLVMGVYQFELTVTDNGGLSVKDTMQLIVDNPLVHQPIACAGADQNITLPNNLIKLNGSCSTDPDNNIISYVWTKIAGPPTFNIANANAVQTQVTNLVKGVYQFELKVTDAGGLSSRDTMQVMVDVVKPPDANAGTDIVITLPLDSVYLSGSSTSDFPVTFQWQMISGPSAVTINNSPIYNLTALVKGLVPGLYSFRLEVSSAAGTSADTMTVSVINNPQDRNTITFKNLKWRLVDEYGSGWADLNLETSGQPNLFIDWDKLGPVEVYLQTDPASQWFIVPSAQSGFFYSYDAARPVIWIARIPPDNTWIGKESSIKVKLL